jgi:SAM-dependent methyltransferase
VDEDVKLQPEGWNDYWASIAREPGEVLWDADAERVAAQDLALFEKVADRRRTLVDFGCGRGTQTHFFARHFDRVVGVDVSEAAIELARSAPGSPNLDYRVLDGLRPERAHALHDEIGDANVYVRGVLHQFQPQERPACAASVEALLGAEGVLFVVELSRRAEAFFESFIMRYGAVPPSLQRAFEFGLRAGGIGEEDFDALFPATRYEVMTTGHSVIHTTHRLPEGGFMEIPASYRVLVRR